MSEQKGNNYFKRQRSFFAVWMALALIITSALGTSESLQVSAAVSKTVSTSSLQSGTGNGLIKDAGPCEKIQDGAILHAWCWSFNTIKNNMKAIADAGYTSVQTSPAGTCQVGNNGNRSLNNWYWHYQPTDYKVGNYQLGSEGDFKAMCDEAKKYGIHIIVDVVANHMAGDQSAIASSYKSISNWCHTTKEIGNWDSRYEVTQLALMGMPDNNTQNKGVQNYIKNYLNKCLSLGADGFRYDAAKHIELPDDSGYGGDFWPTILNNGAKFQYGEILQDGVSRESAYGSYMGVTASSYGMKLRNAVGANNFSTWNLLDYDINVQQDRLVTWVESHDNYANAITDWGSSEWMNDEQIKLAWAVIASRKGGTPLFFSRPVGGGGCSWDNRFPGKSQIGDRGSSLFMDDEVAAVNKFRNAMAGENEYLRNPNGDSKVLMIERGNKGLVAINLNTYDYRLSSITNLKNGVYANQTDNHNTFTVTNGTITGTIPARSVVVLADCSSYASEESGANLYFKKPSGWGDKVYAYVYDESGSSVIYNASWPGKAMTKEANGTYSCSIGIPVTSATKVIFSDGKNQSPSAFSSGFAVTKGGSYNENGLSSGGSSSAGQVTGNQVTIFYYTGWNVAYMHYKIGNGSWTSAPGVRMENASNGYKKLTIDLGSSSSLTACFNNGNGDWDSRNQADYTFTSAGIYTVRDGSIRVGTP